MIFFDQGGNFQGTVRVGHPVEVNPEGMPLQPGNEFFSIKTPGTYHPGGQIDDAGAKSILFQVGAQGTETNRDTCQKQVRKAQGRWSAPRG
jgi:hypothetical protein